MKTFALAAGSALCALGSLVSLVLGVLGMTSANTVTAAWILAGLLLGAAARWLDRSKMRTLYGQSLGDLLHERDEDAAPRELAARDKAALLGRRVGETV